MGELLDLLSEGQLNYQGSFGGEGKRRLPLEFSWVLRTTVLIN